jgi:uncharacterized protein HemY
MRRSVDSKDCSVRIPELPDLRHDLGMLYRKQHQWDKAFAGLSRGAFRQPEGRAGRCTGE